MALCSGKHNPSFCWTRVSAWTVCQVQLDCPKAGKMCEVDRLAKFHIYPVSKNHHICTMCALCKDLPTANIEERSGSPVVACGAILDGWMGCEFYWPRPILNHYLLTSPGLVTFAILTENHMTYISLQMLLGKNKELGTWEQDFFGRRHHLLYLKCWFQVGYQESPISTSMMWLTRLLYKSSLVQSTRNSLRTQVQRDILVANGKHCWKGHSDGSASPLHPKIMENV